MFRNWSNAENLHLRLWNIEHGDVSFLFHKLTVHCKVLKIFQYGKYLVVSP